MVRFACCQRAVLFFSESLRFLCCAARYFWGFEKHPVLLVSGFTDAVAGSLLAEAEAAFATGYEKLRVHPSVRVLLPQPVLRRVSLPLCACSLSRAVCLHVLLLHR